MDPSIISYYKKNKPFIVLLFIWLFRLCFLTQRNEGGVAINKYVLIQIFVILSLAFKLFKKNYIIFKLLKYNATKHFAILYLLGMLSIIWSVFPLMSFFFAFENLVCMSTLLYLSFKCDDVYQLEKYFIYTTIFMTCLFLVKCIFGLTTFHSVTYSSISAMLTMYCLPELYSHNRQLDNTQILKIGLGFGIILLILTTSGGAIFSVFLTFLVFIILSQKASWRMILILIIFLLCILLAFGYQQKILSVLFPNKSMISIVTAHGRTVVWEMINDKVAERPILGWGYATVERLLPIYCTDAHNSIVGIRGSLGNIGCIHLIFTMIYLLLYFYFKKNTFGYRGIFFAVLCAFINSNTTNFLAGKAGPCALTFQFLLILGAAYRIINLKTPNMDIFSNNGYEQQ